MRSKPLMPHARRSAATPLACACWLIACAQALAADAPVFNTRFLKLDGQAADLKAVLSAGNDILPGSYRVDILLNRQLADRRDVLFRQEPDGKVRPAWMPRCCASWASSCRRPAPATRPAWTCPDAWSTRKCATTPPGCNLS